MEKDILIFLINNYYFIHWVLVILFFIEWLGWTGRSIYKNFDAINIKIPYKKPEKETTLGTDEEGATETLVINYPISDIQDYSQTKKDYEPLSLHKVMKAYSLIPSIKILCVTIVLISFLYLIVSHYKYKLINILPIDYLLSKAWKFLICLDIIVIIIRGYSEIGVVLNGLHKSYEKTHPFSIWFPLYVINLWATLKK